jgi:hypothetical protein
MVEGALGQQPAELHLRVGALLKPTVELERRVVVLHHDRIGALDVREPAGRWDGRRARRVGVTTPWAPRSVRARGSKSSAASDGS